MPGFLSEPGEDIEHSCKNKICGWRQRNKPSKWPQKYSKRSNWGSGRLLHEQTKWSEQTAHKYCSAGVDKWDVFQVCRCIRTERVAERERKRDGGSMWMLDGLAIFLQYLFIYSFNHIRQCVGTLLNYVLNVFNSWDTPWGHTLKDTERCKMQMRN